MFCCHRQAFAPAHVHFPMQFVWDIRVHLPVLFKDSDHCYENDFKEENVSYVHYSLDSDSLFLCSDVRTNSLDPDWCGFNIRGT